MGRRRANPLDHGCARSVIDEVVVAGNDGDEYPAWHRPRIDQILALEFSQRLILGSGAVTCLTERTQPAAEARLH